MELRTETDILVPQLWQEGRPRGAEWGVTAPGTMVVSPDRRRCGFRFVTEGYMGEGRYREWVVVDGVPSQECGPGSARWPIVFSPDSSRVAYAANPRDRLGYAMAIDGAWHTHRGPIGPYVFSNDSRRFAYGVTGRDQAVIVDGSTIEVIGDPYQVCLSPGGASVAFSLRRGRGFVVVKDGVEWEPYTDIQQMQYGPTGDRLVVVARRGREWHVVVDGVALPGGDRIGHLCFSQTGNSMAYAARRGNGWCVVVDGKPGREHAGVSDVQFLPGTDTVAYAATERRGFLSRTTSVVIGGVAVSEHKRLYCFQFLPDGRRYWLWCNTGHFLYADGLPLKKLPYADGPPLKKLPVEGLSRPVFSPDGQHFAYIRRVEMPPLSAYQLVVDGERGVFLTGSPLPSGSQFAFVGSKSIELCTQPSGGLLRMRIALEEETA